MKPVDIEAARAYHVRRSAARQALREDERQEWLHLTETAIVRIAKQQPAVLKVYLFGSLVKPGRFNPDSDIDVALACENPAAESAFWQALEQALKRNVDVRPLTGVIAETARQEGMLVYER